MVKILISINFHNSYLNELIEFIKKYFHISKIMNNQEFLKASEDGDLESVKRYLSTKKIDINCRGI